MEARKEVDRNGKGENIWRKDREVCKVRWREEREKRRN